MNSALAQSWIDTSLYPFKSHYHPVKAGNMHYIDEGTGDIILFVHGTPTWSFLYRDFIKELSKTHRCIAIDHIGFGLSDKPNNFKGRPEDHAKNLSLFIKDLNLSGITLVVHDFGGPIGLAAAIENKDRIQKIVLFNTWLWETAQNESAIKVDKVINSSLGKFMYLKMNVSPKMLLKKGFSDKQNLSKNVHQHYVKPFPNKNSRYGLLNMGKSLVGSSEWYGQQWKLLDSLSDKPWLILWGSQDEFISTEYLEIWKRRLPQAQVATYDCGHFVQEEKTLETIKAIKEFVNP